MSKYYADDEPIIERNQKREQYGERFKLRMWHHGEAYGRLDPDELASLAEPPSHSQAALEDVFGDWAKDGDGNDRIKLRVHPHMHRWALYEREYNPKLGANVWRCFYIFQTDPVEGHLPADMDGDKWKAHFRGRVGDYVEPTREHFEMLEKFNIAKYGVNAVNEHAGQLEDKEYVEAEKAEVERTHAFLDEHWGRARDEMHQRDGAGQYMFSGHCDNWAPKSNLSRWRRVDKGSYTLIEKKSAEEYAKEVMAQVIAFGRAWSEAKGLRRSFNPTDIELIAIARQAGIPVDHPSMVDKTDKERAEYSRRQLALAMSRDVESAIIESAEDDKEKAERITALNRIKQPQ